MHLQMQCTNIKIGAKTYSIGIISNEDFDLQLSQYSVNDETIKSFIDYDNQIILIREGFSIEYTRELILHEMIHAFLADVGIETDEKVEQFVSILSPRMNDAFENIVQVFDDLVLL